MPKGKKKGGRKSGDSKKTDSRPPSDEEYDTPDNWSTASVLSDSQPDSIPEEDGNDKVDETGSAIEFEEKLKDAVEGLTQKSAEGRKSCLEGLSKAFSKKYMYDFLIDRKLTVADSVVRCLKKGKGDEQALAAKCLSLLCISLGQDADELIAEMQPVLLTLLKDKSAALGARGECAIAVSMCAFISSSELEDVIAVMEALENIFQGSFKKGDGSVPNLKPEICRLHSLTLTAWGLLLSITPQWHIDKMVQKYLHKMPDLLESQGIDLRIVAGETVALMYEVGREDDEIFEGEIMCELCDQLKKLSTESHKYWTKRDRRLQKSSFRDILRAVQDDYPPEVTVKFGEECLEMYSWVKTMQYSAFCHALGSGINHHLQTNNLVRDVFGLGSPLLATGPKTGKPSKWERTKYNAAAFKARTKARSKHRDKRSVIVGTD